MVSASAMLYIMLSGFGAGISASQRTRERVILHELIKNLKIYHSNMKKTIIALMALVGVASATESDITPITLGVTFDDCAQATASAVTLSVEGVMTGSVASLVQTDTTNGVSLKISGAAGRDKAVFTPDTNVGDGTPWTATFNFENVDKALTSLDSINLGVVLFSGGGDYQTSYASWTGDITFAATITDSTTASQLGTFAYTLTPESGRGSTPFNITLSGTSIDLTDVSSFNMELKLTETLGTGTFAGLKTMGFTGTPVVPEPTTATLSLLALAGLAARRRRK